MLHLEYFAHSCFLLHARGQKVLFDPYSPDVGYKLPPRGADYVLVSHEHFDHNHVAGVPGRCTVVRGCASRQLGELKVHGVLGGHGCTGGTVTIFCVSYPGVNLCHLSDLGEPLSAEQVKEIGPVDVLLAPVGGGYTLDGAGALQVAAQLRPKVLIPMHYRTPFLDRERFPQVVGLEPFLQRARLDYALERRGDGILQLDSWPGRPTVIHLEHRY